MNGVCAFYFFDNGGDDFSGGAGDQVIRYLMGQRSGFHIDLNNGGPSLLSRNGNGSCGIDDRRGSDGKHHTAGLGFFQ